MTGSARTTVYFPECMGEDTLVAQRSNQSLRKGSGQVKGCVVGCMARAL